MIVKPTTAQIQARNRAWKIFRLRGLQSQITMLTEGRAERAIAIIDEEFAAMGAMTKTEHIERLIKQANIEQAKGNIEP